jgi:hypothetical protein
MEWYERELQAGHCLIVVLTPDDAQRKKALDILTAHSGRFIDHFKVWTVETVKT